MTAARYSIGPLTTYVEPEALRRWWLTARDGEEMPQPYAVGPALGRDAPTAVIARQLAAQGKAELVQRRQGKGFAYIIRKRAVPPLAGATGGDSLAPAPVVPAAGSPEARLLALLSEAAADHRACPSHAEIAEALDFEGPRQAKYRFNNLVRGGLIRVIEPNRFTARAIEIAATGARTRASSKGVSA